MSLGYSIRIDWSEEDQANIATCPEFPGLSGVDVDPQSALAGLTEAIEMAIEVMREDGDPLPVPRARETASG